MTYYTYIDSPIGRLMLTSDGDALTGLLMEPHPDPALRVGWVEQANACPLRDAARQLDDYFAGRRSDFDLPLRLEGTGFQQRVWNELRRIPYGATISYTELAQRTGCPGGARAVGQANGSNPVAIVVPCHRVIAAGGKLGGYGGGLRRKEMLLALERGFGIGAGGQ